MAKTLAKQAARYDVEVRGDSTFQRRARLLQSMWRERQGYEAGPWTRFRAKGTPEQKVWIQPGDPDWRPLGSRLRMPDAEVHLRNFLSSEIGALVRAEVDANKAVTDPRFHKLYGEPRIFDDLLSSQPMCFNLFGPLALDLPAATRVARRLWPGRVDQVTAVRFEHSPGRGDPTYLDNRSAADALIEHTTPAGGVGIIAIETKYHEDLRGTSKKAMEKVKAKARYGEVAEASGVFRSPADGALRESPLWQIWLDHLLALAWQQADGLDAALFVLAYPALNLAVDRAAGSYAACLVDGDDSFQALTLEAINSVMADEVDRPEVAAFADRYLAFDRVAER